MTDFGEIIGEFLVESLEGLDRVEGELVTLEERPDDVEVLSSVFRTIHSIKGAAGFLELARLEKLAHAGETLLDSLRAEKVEMGKEIASALLELGDGLRSILDLIESNGNDEAATDPGLMELAERLLSLSAPGDDVASAAAAEEDGAPERGDEGPGDESAEEAADAGVAEPEAVVAPAEDAPAASAPARRAGPSAAESNIRVRVDQLDTLMNLAGELVLARNQIVQHALKSSDATASATAQHLNHITSELQERIMQIRMQPIGLQFNKFPRVVRDLATQLDKDVELEVRGAETELDKSLLEAVKDPLTHLVRNSMDHGIESPEERVRAGKPATARLVLSAFHESGQVVILIEDDGRGIDLEKIREKAVQKGVVTNTAAAALDDRGVLDLLFKAGFSTAEKVTNVSGRGVGMDVVRSNLEAVGGTVSIETELGKGTRVVVRLPLTLAIIPALTIRSGDECFAIPQANLVELVLIESERDERIEWLHGKPVFRLRGRLLSVLDLGGELGNPNTETGSDCDTQAIVVVQASGRRLGLLVDEILETEEIVVKPLDRRVKDLGVYAGTTILGDGRVALILDVAGIASRADLSSDADLDEHSGLGGSAAIDAEDLVVVNVGGGRRMAFPIAEVTRLEELDPGEIETIGRGRVTQYRGDIMPLIDLGTEFPGDAPRDSEREKIRAIVHTTPAGNYGFLIDEVVDIVGAEAEGGRQAAPEPGIAEIVVAAGRVTEVLDVHDVIARSLLAKAGAARAEVPDEPAVLGALEVTNGDVQICSFRLSGGLYGFDVLEVQEVLPPQEATSVPLAKSEVEGLINLRGDTVVLIDLAQKLGLRGPGEAPDMETCMHVVLRTEAGVVAVMVDEIGEVLELDESRFECCPNSFDEARRRLSKGVFKIDDDLLLQLNVATIAEDAQTPETPALSR